MTGSLDRELRAYELQRERLLATAENKYVLIHADDVVETFDSPKDAWAQGYARFGLQPFLVKQVLRIEVPENFVSNLLGV